MKDKILSRVVFSLTAAMVFVVGFSSIWVTLLIDQLVGGMSIGWNVVTFIIVDALLIATIIGFSIREDL